MGVVNETTRKPNYYNDIEKYGKFGEDIFINYAKDKCCKKGYRLIDVREDKEYQKKDIDFIIDKGESGEEKIEVKVDTRALETGNLPFEYISHCASGWSVATECDKVFMVLAEDGYELKAMVALWIDMTKWKEWMSVRDSNGRMINYIKSESGIVDILCKIEVLKEKGIILSEVPLNKRDSQ